MFIWQCNRRPVLLILEVNDDDTVVGNHDRVVLESVWVVLTKGGALRGPRPWADL
jgi:hypothetical protein